MLTVVITALEQQEEMVTVITCFYIVFEFTEFPRTGMCTAPNSSTNQGPWVRTLIHVMYIRYINPFYREKCSGRNEGFKVSLLDSLYAARQHTVQNKERAN